MTQRPPEPRCHVGDLTQIQASCARRRSTPSSFITRLLECGVADIGPWRESTVGLFFVAKAGGKLGMIADTRFANCAFRPPASTRLPTAAAYSRIELPSPPLFLAQSDLADAFYHFRLPAGLEE